MQWTNILAISKRKSLYSFISWKGISHCKFHPVLFYVCVCAWSFLNVLYLSIYNDTINPWHSSSFQSPNIHYARRRNEYKWATKNKSTKKKHKPFVFRLSKTHWHKIRQSFDSSIQVFQYAICFKSDLMPGAHRKKTVSTKTTTILVSDENPYNRWGVLNVCSKFESANQVAYTLCTGREDRSRRISRWTSRGETGSWWSLLMDTPKNMIPV